MTRLGGAGDRFQKATRHARHRESRESETVPRRPSLYKRYTEAESFHLARPVTRGGDPLWSVVRARRSVRSYTGRPVTASALSQMLWATQGITAGSGTRGLRAAPSAGALYPVETYAVIHAVDDFVPGVYHYDVEQHHLEQIKLGDFRDAMQKAALDQEIAARAAVVCTWSAVFNRCKYDYGQRAYRYIYLDAGHIAQNLALASVALGLASCPIAAFYDDELNAIIGVDGDEESVIYMTAVGEGRGR